MAPPEQASLPQGEAEHRRRKVLLDAQSRTISPPTRGLNRLCKRRHPIMSRVIRNTGYVLLAAGGLTILASFAGFVMMESFDKLQVREAWSCVAVAPGIATVLLGWFVTMYERYLDWVGPNPSSNN